MHCGECRYWCQDRGEYFGVCFGIEKDDEADVDALAAIHREGDGTAVLMTNANFGCLHFEPKA